MQEKERPPIIPDREIPVREIPDQPNKPIERELPPQKPLEANS